MVKEGGVRLAQLFMGFGIFIKFRQENPRIHS